MPAAAKFFVIEREAGVQDGHNRTGLASGNVPGGWRGNRRDWPLAGIRIVRRGIEGIVVINRIRLGFEDSAGVGGNRFDGKLSRARDRRR